MTSGIPDGPWDYLPGGGMVEYDRDGPRVPPVDVAYRLQVMRSNFAAAIRGCQTAGMTQYEIQKIIGVNDVVYAKLLAFWGLDT